MEKKNLFKTEIVLTHFLLQLYFTMIKTKYLQYNECKRYEMSNIKLVMSQILIQ